MSCRCLLVFRGGVLAFNGAHHGRDLPTSFHAPEPVFTMQTHRRQPALRHLAAPIPFDVPLAIPDRGKQAFDGIGGVQGLAQERRHLQAVQGEQLLEGFPERIRGGLIEPAEPPL